MSSLRRLYDRAISGPDYPPNDADLADIRLFGLSFPLRASLVVLVTTAVILIDQTGWSFAWADDLVSRLGSGSHEPAVKRFLLFMVVPLLVVLGGFRDDPGRYGLRAGNWRWGLGLLLAGLAIMTPIILSLAGLESFRAYYGASAQPLATRVVDHLVELIPAEFLLRGFLMFALWRRIGPLALVVSLVPFVLTHVGKPDIELWSTFVGGSIFAWLDWRTGSILWSALGHVYVLTLLSVAVGGAAAG